MEQIIIYILIGGLCFWAGFKIATAISGMAFRVILEDLGVSDERIHQLINKYDTTINDKEEEKGPEDGLETIEIKIEQHGGQLYAFRLDTDEFLGQGTDREALIKRLAEKLVDVRLIIREENGAGLIKQEG